MRDLLPYLWAVALSWVIALVTLPRLPERVPIHWNAAGEPDGYSTALFAALFMPLLLTVLMVLFAWVPLLDPRRGKHGLFHRPYFLLTTAVLGFMLLLQVTMTASQLGYAVSIPTVFSAGIGALFIAIGLILPGLRSNWFAGIRTPWTLESEQVWAQTHRVGGWTFAALGVASIVVAFLAPTIAIWLVVGGVLCAALGLAGYSYVLWSREKRKGRQSRIDGRPPTD